MNFTLNPVNMQLHFIHLQVDILHYFNTQILKRNLIALQAIYYKLSTQTDLNNITHKTSSMEPLRRYSDSDIAFHLTLGPHLLQFGFLSSQLLALLERRFRHVGNQVSVLYIVTPRFLVSKNVNNNNIIYVCVS